MRLYSVLQYNQTRQKKYKTISYIEAKKFVLVSKISKQNYHKTNRDRYKVGWFDNTLSCYLWTWLTIFYWVHFCQSLKKLLKNSKILLRIIRKNKSNKMKSLMKQSWVYFMNFNFVGWNSFLELILNTT